LDYICVGLTPRHALHTPSLFCRIPGLRTPAASAFRLNHLGYTLPALPLRFTLPGFTKTCVWLFAFRSFVPAYNAFLDLSYSCFLFSVSYALRVLHSIAGRLPRCRTCRYLRSELRTAHLTTSRRLPHLLPLRLHVSTCEHATLLPSCLTYYLRLYLLDGSAFRAATLLPRVYI